MAYDAIVVTVMTADEVVKFFLGLSGMKTLVIFPVCIRLFLSVLLQ